MCCTELIETRVKRHPMSRNVTGGTYFGVAGKVSLITEAIAASNLDLPQ